MPHSARRAVFLLLLVPLDSPCTVASWLQVPSGSVFVTRFMGGYTENVPPDEFDALPVRLGNCRGGVCPRWEFAVLWAIWAGCRFALSFIW